MKRTLPLFLALALGLSLSACQPAEKPAPTPAPGQFVFTRENFPRLDGSTSIVPLGEAVASVLLGESREEVADLIHFNKTSRAYFNLVDGQSDLLLAAGPGEDSENYANENGQGWLMEAFAVEGLVFFVNADNPVDNLTLDQVRGIYTGEITNWSEVGGSDAPIQAYQRPAGGGSQNIMDEEVMEGLTMMEPANTDYVVATMEGIIQAVRAWDDQPDAIGYTVYYYADDMGMADGLKLLSIDGVAPSDDTIRSGDYPILSHYWAVMDAKTDYDSPTGQLFQWLCYSQEGQDLVAHEGYVSVKEPSK